MVDRANDGALEPVTAPGHPNRLRKTDRQAEQQPGRRGPAGHGRTQPPGENAHRRQVKSRQQHRDAPPAAQRIGRADQQRSGGIDHALPGKAQVLPQVGGIGVGPAARRAELLIMQPGHRHGKDGQRQQSRRPQRAAFSRFGQRRSPPSRQRPRGAAACIVCIMIPRPRLRRNGKSSGPPLARQPAARFLFVLGRALSTAWRPPGYGRPPSAG